MTDDKSKLDRLPETSAEIEAELEQLDSLLEDIPDLEPPESLHSRIMAQLESPAASSKAAVIKPSVMEWLRPLLAGSGLRYALAGAAGAVLAALFIGGQSAIPVTGNNADLVGTMAPRGGFVAQGRLDSKSRGALRESRRRAGGGESARGREAFRRRRHRRR